MSAEGKPSRRFVYPGGEPVCLKGRVIAASWGIKILNGELSAEELAQRAREGQFTVEKPKEKHGRYNLLALLVARHAKHGDLTDFVNPDGDFVASKKGMVENINDSQHKKLRLR